MKMIALIYSPSESSGELSKLAVICLITFFPMYLHSLKTLVDKSSHLFWEQNPSWLLLNKYDQSPPLESLYSKNLFITIRFILVFKKILLRTGWLSNYFLISEMTLSQILLYFSNKLSSSMKKYIHLFCPSRFST